MGEFHFIKVCLDSIKTQKFKNFEVYICVNQPEEYWDLDDKKEICENNASTIELLKNESEIPLKLFDKNSRNNGWQGKYFGVGAARKFLMDEIIKDASENDIIVSLDADTYFGENYFQSIFDIFLENPKTVGLSNPYYHPLTSDENANRAILHYEIYMRYYAINLWRINSPYSFTALGSAMAFPVWAYKALGGLTAKKSGEDFYFLQKLRKYGTLLNWNKEKVYPASRFSDRVFFGTGPAMIKGNNGDWESYPIYDYHLFDKISETYQLFSKLFKEDIETPMSEFISQCFKEGNIWEALRLNNKDEKHFVKACHDKIDGLRILQFLKSAQNKLEKKDEENLVDFLKTFHSNSLNNEIISVLDEFDFNKSSITDLNKIRDLLIVFEENTQKTK